MTLDEYLESRRDNVFAWGVNDCGKFCAGWGLECGVALPFDWSSEAEAQAVIAEYGSLEAAVSSVLGEPKPPLLAAAGDICQAFDGSLGICVGHRVATPTERGMRFAPMQSYERCWSCRKQ